MAWCRLVGDCEIGALNRAISTLCEQSEFPIDGHRLDQLDGGFRIRGKDLEGRFGTGRNFSDGMDLPKIVAFAKPAPRGRHSGSRR